MCQMTCSEREYHELSGLCERCGEPADASPCAACLDDEREQWSAGSVRYEPGYALLVDTSGFGDSVPW